MENPQVNDPLGDEPLGQRDYAPIQPRGTDWRGLVRKITGPIVFIFGLIVKLGSLFRRPL